MALPNPSSGFGGEVLLCLDDGVAACRADVDHGVSREELAGGLEILGLPVLRQHGMYRGPMGFYRRCDPVHRDHLNRAVGHHCHPRVGGDVADFGGVRRGAEPEALRVRHAGTFHQDYGLIFTSALACCKTTAGKGFRLVSALRTCSRPNTGRNVVVAFEPLVPRHIVGDDQFREVWRTVYGVALAMFFRVD